MYNILEGSFKGCELRHIARSSNDEADRLANIGSTKAPIPPGVFLEQINKRSVKVRKHVESTAASTPEICEPSKSAAAEDIELEQVYLIEPVWTRKFLDYLIHK